MKKTGVIKKEPYLLDQASKYYNISMVSSIIFYRDLDLNLREI